MRSRIIFSWTSIETDLILELPGWTLDRMKVKVTSPMASLYRPRKLHPLFYSLLIEHNSISYLLKGLQFDDTRFRQDHITHVSQSGINLCFLFVSLCLCLQPDELTNALEISNIVFTSLFSLEMLLKVLVYGPFGYIKNPYNIFDGIIVVIR